MEISLEELQHILEPYSSCILYKPLKHEVSYTDSIFPLKLPPSHIALPNDKSADPFEWAHACIQYFKDSQIFLLIPGSRFDLQGTRHGRGEGWYDKFLSKTPKEWLRIGITTDSQLSITSLRREPWDEPMNLILAKETDSWKAYKCI